MVTAEPETWLLSGPPSSARESQFTLANRIVRAAVVYLLGAACLYLEYALGVTNFPTFAAFYALMFLAVPPRRAISPLSILYGYYGVWFVLTPMFAEIYQGDALTQPEFVLALSFAYTVFGLGVIAICAGEYFIARTPRAHVVDGAVPLARVRRWILLLYVTSTAAIVMIVMSSGGLEKWIADPGDAFLNRTGSGVYVIASHFSSLALAALSGWWAYASRRKLPIFMFLLWVALTSPVHGSKGQISLLVILAVLPWLKDMRFFSRRSYTLYVAFLGIFFLGLYFRNLSWIDAETMIPYALNYFTALENLAISIRDFEPQFIRTFYLPFVKFATPFGLTDPSMYFDMNHMLTDFYYPHAWEIRATEQWPVETDLYLNFFFWGGLPLVAGYLFFIGAIFEGAVKSNSLGAWFAATIMTVLMLSHLRGSLINHTDFYMYPYILMMYLVLRGIPIRRALPPQRVRASPAVREVTVS